MCSLYGNSSSSRIFNQFSIHIGCAKAFSRGHLIGWIMNINYCCWAIWNFCRDQSISFFFCVCAGVWWMQFWACSKFMQINLDYLCKPYSQQSPQYHIFGSDNDASIGSMQLIMFWSEHESARSMTTSSEPSKNNKIAAIFLFHSNSNNKKVIGKYYCWNKARIEEIEMSKTNTTKKKTTSSYWKQSNTRYYTVLIGIMRQTRRNECVIHSLRVQYEYTYSKQMNWGSKSATQYIDEHKNIVEFPYAYKTRYLLHDMIVNKILYHRNCICLTASQTRLIYLSPLIFRIFFLVLPKPNFKAIRFWCANVTWYAFSDCAMHVTIDRV